MRSSEKLTPPPANAFAPDYLKLLGDRDDSPTGAEAAFSGPWRVEREIGGPGFGIYRFWQGVTSDEPEAVLKYRDTAQLLAAVLPVMGREPLYRLRREELPGGGFAIETWHPQDGAVQSGRLRYFHADAVDALNVLDGIVRSPAALALVLDAAGESALKAVGRLLWEYLVARPR